MKTKTIFMTGLVVCGVAAMSCMRRKDAVLSGSGTFEAVEILVGARTAGTVVGLYVSDGDSVRDGQAIAQIDTEKIDLGRRQILAGLEELRYTLQSARRSMLLAEENLHAVQKKFNRIHALFIDSSATQQQYDDAESLFKAAQTQSENAQSALEALKAKEKQLDVQRRISESQLRDARIVAPISGIITETFVERGEIARPGGAIATVADLGRMWVKIYVKEVELGKIVLNQRAELRIAAYPNRVFEGRVSWISPKAEFTPKMVQTRDARSDLVYAVRVDIENPGGIFKIGMPVDAVLVE